MACCCCYCCCCFCLRPIKPRRPPSRLPGRSQAVQRSPNAAAAAAAAAGSSDQAGTLAAAAGSLSTELSAFTITSEPSTNSVVGNGTASAAEVTAAAAAGPAAAPLLLPEPYLGIHRVNGYTGLISTRFSHVGLMLVGWL